LNENERLGKKDMGNKRAAFEREREREGERA